MAADPPREQEQQIKERKRLLYDADDTPAFGSADRKPFSVYLRETPAAPLSGGVKAALWGTAILVALLLAGALMKSMQGKAPKSTKKRAEVRPASISAPRLA